ncbi:MAG: ABC transporter ATP-binding protein, partial [Cyanobacteria bacterium P01_F01_bin.116]
MAFFPTPNSASMISPAVFHMEQVSKVYVMGEVEVHALGAVDLDLYEGEFVVLLGPSGSGKSTLLNILGGLDVPSAGQVYFRNQAMNKADEQSLTRFRRQSVGFVFQFYNLIPSLTARENVALVTDIAR